MEAYDPKQAGFGRELTDPIKIKSAATYNAAKALRAIQAKTLLMSGREDLITPEDGAVEAARSIPDARHVFINPPTELGHSAVSGNSAPENEHLNLEIARFLERVDERDEFGSKEHREKTEQTYEGEKR